MRSSVKSESFVFDIQQRDSLLFNTGLLFLIISLMMIALIPIDPRHTPAGISPWIKPIKFALSFSSYLLTMAFFLEYLKITPLKARFLSRLITFFMVVEMTSIILQAVRGTPYYFNVSHLSQPLGSAICYNMCLFMIANIIIVANTITAVYIFYLFFKKTHPLPKAYLWSIRLGLAVFLLSCLEGAFIVFHSTHCMEQAIPGSWGIPFISKAPLGDLKTSHFFGIHAMQALPILGYMVKDKIWGTLAVFFGTFLYSAIFASLLIHALIWIPFISCVKPPSQ